MKKPILIAGLCVFAACDSETTMDAGIAARPDAEEVIRDAVFSDARTPRADVGFIDFGPRATGNSIRVIIDGEGQGFTNLVYSVTSTGPLDRVILRADNDPNPRIPEDNESYELVFELDTALLAPTSTTVMYTVTGTTTFPVPEGAGVSLDESGIVFTATTSHAPVVTRTWFRRRCTVCPRDVGEVQSLTGTVSMSLVDADNLVGAVEMDIAGQIPFLTPSMGPARPVEARFEATFNLPR